MVPCHRTRRIKGDTSPLQCLARIWLTPAFVGDPSIFLAPSGLGWGYLYASTRGRCAPGQIARIQLGGLCHRSVLRSASPFGAVRGLARPPTASTGKFVFPGWPSRALPRKDKLPPPEGGPKKNAVPITEYCELILSIQEIH